MTKSYKSPEILPSDIIDRKEDKINGKTPNAFSYILDVFAFIFFTYLFISFKDWQWMEFSWQWFRKTLIFVIFYLVIKHTILKPLWHRILYGKLDRPKDGSND